MKLTVVFYIDSHDETHSRISVQQVMTDVLLLWNFAKQLDQTKSDRRDLDSLAIEQFNREKGSAKLHSKRV